MTNDFLTIMNILLIAYTIVGSLRRHKPEVKKIDAETQSSLSQAVEGTGKTLVEVWKRIDILEKTVIEQKKEIDSLREESRRWRNSYAKSIRFIRERITDEIPDFTMDTQDLRPYRKDSDA